MICDAVKCGLFSYFLNFIYECVYEIDEKRLKNIEYESVNSSGLGFSLSAECIFPIEILHLIFFFLNLFCASGFYALNMSASSVKIPFDAHSQKITGIDFIYLFRFGHFNANKI